MTDVAVEAIPKKPGKMGLVVLTAVVLLAGGGGFAAGSMGLIPVPLGQSGDMATEPGGHDTAMPSSQPAEFHQLPELVIPLGNALSSQYLRANLYLEIDPSAAALLRQTEPRIVDTLNIFLRAVDERDMSSILAMENLRAEMLRRVRLVTGDKAVRAVLIGEFLLR